MKNLISILLFIVSLNSCTKNNDTETITQDQLPAITTSGANTAGCIINGKVLIPKNGINGISGFTVYGLQFRVESGFYTSNNNGYFSITIYNLKDKGKSYWIYIHLNNVVAGSGNYIVNQSNGEFFLDGPNNPQIIVRETFDNISGKTFLSAPNSGNIKIERFDSIARIYSGTFNCKLYNKDNTAEIIEVKDGRFDINAFTLIN